MTRKFVVMAAVAALGVTASTGAMARAPALKGASTTIQLQKWARCEVNAGGRDAFMQVISTDPGTPKEAAALQRVAETLDGTDCAAGLTPASASANLRGVVAEALYQADFGRDTQKLMDRMATNVDRERGASAVGEGDALNNSFATCIALRQPDSVVNLLATSPESGREASAFSTISGSFTGCLNKGEEVRLDKPRLRGLLAEMMYRMLSGYGPVLTAQK